MPFKDPDRKRAWDREYQYTRYHTMTWIEREAKLLRDNKSRRWRRSLTKTQNDGSSTSGITTETATTQTPSTESESLPGLVLSPS